MNAQSTIIDYDAYSLKFTVINESAAECSVTCSTPPTVETELTIPSSVTIDGVDYAVTYIEDYGFHECEKFVGDLLIPNTVTEIGDRVFRSCTGFNGTITLSENLESIGEMAFGGGGYTVMNFTGKLTIPSSVEYIGDACFQNCSYLTSLEFEENSQITTISQYSFFNCSGLTGELVIPDAVSIIEYVGFCSCKGLTSLQLPNGIKTIGEGAFHYADLLRIEIPKSVSKLESSVFINCSDSLEIRYKGTIDEWNAIEKDEGWNLRQEYGDGTEDDEIYESVICSDGVVSLAS
jgi:hypothetical protein